MTTDSFAYSDRELQYSSCITGSKRINTLLHLTIQNWSYTESCTLCRAEKMFWSSSAITPPTILGVGFRVPNACSGWQVTPYVLRYQFSMSTEKLPLQPLVNHAAGGQETEPDPGSLPETGQEDGKEHGDQALHKTKLKHFKGIFITVIVLVGFAVINAAVSVILPFYPIVVSSLIHHPS